MNERLDRLEQELTATKRRLGRMQIAFALTVVAGLCVALVRPAVTQGKGLTVKAPFTVVDANGRRLLRVFADEKGGQLTLYNKAGENIAYMGANSRGGFMDVHNNAGKEAAWMGTIRNGGLVHLHYNDGNAAASMKATSFGGSLELYDRGENVLFRAP